MNLLAEGIDLRILKRPNNRPNTYQPYVLHLPKQIHLKCHEGNISNVKENKLAMSRYNLQEFLSLLGNHCS